MASHIFQTPAMNPIPLVLMDAVTNAAFYTKHLRKDWYQDSYLWWNRKSQYYQKWRNGDTITFQVNTNDLLGGTIVCTVIDCNAVTIATIALNNSLQAAGNTQNGVQLDTYQYRIPLDNATYPPGRYCVLVTTVRDGETRRYISEPMDVAADWPGTLLYRYKGTAEDPHNVWWVLKPNFQFRAEGEFRNYRSIYDDSRFINQIKDPQLLHSDRIRECELFVGAKLYRHSEMGLPAWALDIIEEILVCPTLNIDQKNFVRAENSTLDRTERTPTPLSTGTVALQEKRAIDTTTYGTGDLQLFERPATFPYALADLSMSDAASTIPLSPLGVNVVEILDSTAENAYLASLNAIGLDGVFTTSGGFYFYSNGPDESYSSATGVTMAGYFDTTITGGGAFGYTYAGDHIIVGSNLAGQYLPASGIANNGFTLPGGNSGIRFYHKNTINRLYFIAPIDVPVLTAFDGDLPVSMIYFQIIAHNIPLFDLANILPAKNSLSSFKVEVSGLDNIGTGPYFVTTPANAFANLVNIDLSTNTLSSTQVDNILISLADNTNYSGGGSIDLSGQTPAAPPTISSAPAIFDLQAAGWSVYTD